MPFGLGDYAKNTSTIHPENLIKFNSNNYLYSQKRRLLSGEVKANYDFTKEKEKFSPVEVKLHLTPPLPYTEYLYLHFVYNLYRAEYEEIKGGFGLKDAQWNLKVGMNRYPQQNLTDITTQGDLSLGGKWTISTYLSIPWRKRAWKGKRTLPEREYWIALNMKAFPGLGFKYHPGRELVEYQ